MYTMIPTAAICIMDNISQPMTSSDFNVARFEEMPQTSFRLLDDDGITYFEGRMTLERLDGDESQCFAPLDRTQDAYGCTELQYLHAGTWETL